MSPSFYANCAQEVLFCHYHNSVPTARNAALLDVSEAEQVFRVPRQAGFSCSGRAARWPTSRIPFSQETSPARCPGEGTRFSRSSSRAILAITFGEFAGQRGSLMKRPKTAKTALRFAAIVGLQLEHLPRTILVELIIGILAHTINLAGLTASKCLQQDLHARSVQQPLQS